MPIIGGGGSSGGSGINVLSYVEFTSNVSVVSTTEGTPTAVVSAAATSHDGLTPICVEFFSPGFLPQITAQRGLILNLWDSTTNLGRLAEFQTSAAAAAVGAVLARRYFTPSAGSHTFKAQAWSTPDGSGSIFAGTGGAGNFLAGYIRVTTGS